MNIEQKLRELAERKRPFSHPFPATEGDAYLIDNTFTFRISEPYRTRRAVEFVADTQLPILREYATKDKGQTDKSGIGLLVLTFTPSQRVVYLGDKYKFSFRKVGNRDYFQLQSASPIDFKPVPKNIDLKVLVAQRTQSTNI